MRRHLLLLGCGLPLACAGETTGPRPDVVILMLDTTRADHLGPFTEQDPRPTPFLDRLATQSVVFENAWAAATDHGEESREHGDIMHRFSVHQELARAGLMLRAPGLSAGRSELPAQHSDLLPTILALLDLPPPEVTNGVALGEPPGEAGEERALLTCRVDSLKGRQLWGLPLGSWRLLEEQPGGGVRLYNKKRDPREKRDLAQEQPKVVARLRARLEALRASLEPVPRERVTVDLSEKLNDELSHLGYVGDE